MDLQLLTVECTYGGLTANGTSNQFHVLDFHTLKWAKIQTNQAQAKYHHHVRCSTQHGRNGHKYIRAWKRDILGQAREDDSTFQFNTDTALWEKNSNGQIYKETGIGGSSISFDRQNKEAILLGGYKEGTLDELGKLKIKRQGAQRWEKIPIPTSNKPVGPIAFRPQE